MSGSTKQLRSVFLIVISLGVVGVQAWRSRDSILDKLGSSSEGLGSADPLLAGMPGGLVSERSRVESSPWEEYELGRLDPEWLQQSRERVTQGILAGRSLFPGAPRKTKVPDPSGISRGDLGSSKSLAMELGATLTSDEGCMAVIEGRVIRQGEVFQGADGRSFRLLEVGRGVVELESEGKRLRLAAKKPPNRASLSDAREGAEQ